jgi:hypothetical protein
MKEVGPALFKEKVGRDAGRIFSSWRFFRIAFAGQPGWRCLGRTGFGSAV